MERIPTTNKPILTLEDVFDLIRAERQHQDTKHGPIEHKNQSVAGYLHVAQAELDEALAGWCKNVPGKHSALAELIQVAAVCCCAIEQYGPEGN